MMMCLAIPGQIVEMSGTDVMVNFGGNRVRVAATFTPEARIGDWVLVHAGFAISVIDHEAARATWEYLRASPGACEEAADADESSEPRSAAAARDIGTGP